MVTDSLGVTQTLAGVSLGQFILSISSKMGTRSVVAGRIGVTPLSFLLLCNLHIYIIVQSVLVLILVADQQIMPSS
jgi:uncharacterized membrane protein